MHTLSDFETEPDPAVGRVVRHLHSADDVRMDMLVLLGVEGEASPADVRDPGIGRLRLARHAPRLQGEITIETGGGTRPDPLRETTEPVAEITEPTERSEPTAPVHLEAPAPAPLEEGIAVPTVLLPWLVAGMVALALGVGLLMMLAAGLIVTALLF